MNHRLVKGGVGALALSMLIAQPLSAVQAAPRSAAGFQGTISFYAQTYNPTKSMVLSSTNTTPRRAMRLVADAWEKKHPGVHIKFVAGPAGDYQTWARTVLTGESAPDMIWWQTDPAFTDNGKIVQLDKWLQQPNPYNPSGGKWMDTFQPPYKTVAQSPNHHYGWVPMDLVSTGVYYNKTLLKKAGLNPNNYKPATWAQWMKDLAQVKSRAGAIPFCSYYVPQEWWAWGSLGDQLMWQDIQKYDVLRYQPTHIPGTVGVEEMVRATLRKGWLPSTDQGFRELMRVMKEWSPTWCAGWAAATRGNDYQNFVQGKEAFMWEGTWTSAQLKNDPRRGFDIGTFYLPSITQETSKSVKPGLIKPKGVGGYGSLNYAVTKTAVNDGSVNMAVDFLQYLTTPANDSTVVNEQPQFVVSVKGAPDKSGLTKFFEGEKAMVNGFAYGIAITGIYGPKWKDKLVQIFTEYAQGQRDLDSAMKALDKVAVEEANAQLLLNDKTKTKLGTWDTSKW